MKVLKHLPNALTCANLVCGVLGIIQVFEGDLKTASFYMFLAAVFDFFDGFAARMLRVSGELGKQLDSLADGVTFGVLPSLILYKLIQQGSMDMETPRRFVALVVVVFSILRLAKFNLDTRQTDSFIGVPTPANGLFVAALPLVIYYQPEWAGVVLNPVFLIVYAVVISYLMVSELPLFSLKFKNFRWKDNRGVYVFLILCLLLLFSFKFLGLALCIVLYVVWSAIAELLKLKR